MAKKRIALQYSGFMLFAAKIVSVIMGLAFNLMLARSVVRTELSDEYGVWGNLNYILIPYFTLVSGVIPFWSMRFMVRGKEGAAKTGVLANTLVAVAATAVYLALIPLLTWTFKAQAYTLIYIIASLQIIETYLISVLESCLQAEQPQYVGYGLLVGDAFKLSLGFVLMGVFRQSILGAILSVVIAFAVRIFFYLEVLSAKLHEKINFSYVKEWLKGSAFNLYNILGDRIAASAFIMLSYYGGEIATAYYTASAIVAAVVTYSSMLAFALYPKLLSERNMADATTSLKMVLMFAIPMAGGILGLADSYLVIQDPSYCAAVPVISTLAVDALIVTVASIYQSVLLGIERVDEKAQISMRQVAKSRLFVVFSLPYVHSIVTLPATAYVGNTIARSQPQLIATFVVAINAIARLAMFIVLYVIVRRVAKVTVPYWNIAKYVFASAVMVFILFLIPHPTTIVRTLAATAAGGLVYVATLFFIDGETRVLAFSVLREIKNWVKTRSKPF